MDPEIVERLNEQFREMFEILSEQNSMMAAQMKAMKDQVDSSGKVTKAQKEQGEKTEENTKKQEAYAKAEAERQAAVQQATAKINRALDFTAGAFLSLGSAVMDSTHSFQKYNGTIGMVGDAAAGLGENFGVLGHVIGGVIKASTKLIQYQLTQADSLLKFNDQVSKMGAMNAFGSEEILKMGHKAGFAAKDLEKLTAPMQKLGSAFKQIGSNAEDSTRKFMEMAAVGTDARQEFQRLGYSQEQLVEAQSGYIETMGGAGLAVRALGNDMRTLKSASLDYVKNLQVLSELSGQSAEAQQQQMAAAAADMQFQIYAAEQNKKIEAATSEEEKKRLQEQFQLVLATKEMLTRTQGEDVARAYGQGVAGGPMTQGLGQMAVSGTYNEVQRLANLGRQDQMTEQQLASSQDYMVKQVRDTITGPLKTAFLVSGEAANELAGGYKVAAESNRLSGYDAEGAVKKARDAIDANEKGTGPAAEDGYQQARNFLTESEIALRTGFDKLAFSIGIAIPAIVALGATAGLAALALGKGGALLGRLGGVLGGIRGAGAGAAAAGAGAAGAGAAAAGASKLGKLGTLAKGAGRVLGKLAAPLAAGMALYDAYQGFNADADASFGGKLKNAGKSALSGLTFGLLGSSPEEIAKEKASAGAATTTAQPEEKQKSDIPDSVVNSFNTSVAAFGKIVAAFGKIVTAFAKTVKASNTATSDFTKTVKMFNIIMSPISALASAGSRVKGKNSGLLGGTVSEDDELDVADYIEKLKTSLNDTALAGDRLREAEMKRHRFTEESMTQFRRSLEDLTKTIGGITGIDRTEDDKDKKSSGGNAGGNAGGGEGAGSSDNAKKAMEYFMQQGWTKEQSAGIVGNLQQESGKDLDPSSENEIGMYGIAQWDKTRRKQFEKAMGKSIYGSSLEDQLAFIQHELTEGEDGGAKKAGRKLKSADTANEAASTFEKYYERSGGHAMGKRIANAESLMSDDRAAETPEKSKEGGGFSSINAQGKSAMVASEVAPKFQSLLDKMTSEGYKIRSLGGYSDRNVAGTGTKSAHSRGWAIDVNPSQNPLGNKLITDMPDEVVEHARSLGLGWGGDWSSKKDAMHYSAQKNEGGYLKARKGGIFDGPDKGYPVELHGGEMVAPLKQDSVLMKLAKTPATAEEESKPMTPSSTILQKEIFEKVASMNSEMVDNMVRKLDDMVNAIIDGNDTREKILKNSQA